MTTVPKPTALTSTFASKYDAWNRLALVYVDVNTNGDYDAGTDTLMAKYEYDGRNRRVKAHIDAQAPAEPNGVDHYRHFYYNAGWQILETRKTTSENDAPDGANAEIQYVWSARYIDAPVLRDEDKDSDGDCTESGTDERLYYLTDANMNVTTLVEDDGDVAERYVYDPYGKATAVYSDNWSTTVAWSASKKNPIRFGGYFFDNETGLYSVRNRTYHPNLGCWMQRDPLGYADGMSLYEYCRSGPLGTTDSSGLLVREAFAGYKAFREEGQNPIEAARRTLVAGAIAKVAFDYGEAARAESIEQGSTPSEAAGIANAKRHAAGSAALTKVFGEGVAKKIMDSHEEGQEDTPDSRVDQYNNEVGRRIGKESDDWDEIKQKVENALKKGDLVTHEDDPRVNPPNTAKQKPA